MSDVVVFGVGEFAEVAAAYLENDSPHTVVAFTLDRQFCEEDAFAGRPLIPYDSLAEQYPPGKALMLVAIGFSGLNEVRQGIYERCKAAGYEFVSYVCSQAVEWGHTTVGENSFVFENNVLQPFCRIGNNCVLWSGNHIGHHAVIEDHCFITSHVVVSGGTVVGRNCFVGVNATLADHIRIGENCVIGGGALVLKDAEPGGAYFGSESERSRIPALRIPGFRRRKAG